MTESVLESSDKHALFDFIDACHLKAKKFDDHVFPRLKRLLACEMFAYGTIDFGGDRKLRHLGGSMPVGVIDEGAGPRRGAFYALARDWLSSREPSYLEVGCQTLSAACGVDSRTRGTGMVIGLHGVADAGHRSASWYAFSKAAFSDRDDHIVRIVVPHLHSALASVNASNAQVAAGFKPLTPRELEILQWLAKGKANADISMLLGISVCTVRVHIQNLFNKLPANNRTHAAARALQLGLLETVKPVTREPYGVLHGARNLDE